MTSSSRSVRSFAGGLPMPVSPVSYRVLVFQIWFTKFSETARAVNAGFGAHANPAVESADPTEPSDSAAGTPSEPAPANDDDRDARPFPRDEGGTASSNRVSSFE